MCLPDVDQEKQQHLGETTTQAEKQQECGHSQEKQQLHQGPEFQKEQQSGEDQEIQQEYCQGQEKQ